MGFRVWINYYHLKTLNQLAQCVALLSHSSRVPRSIWTLTMIKRLLKKKEWMTSCPGSFVLCSSAMSPSILLTTPHKRVSQLSWPFWHQRVKGNVQVSVPICIYKTNHLLSLIFKLDTHIFFSSGIHTEFYEWGNLVVGFWHHLLSLTSDDSTLHSHKTPNLTDMKYEGQHQRWRWNLTIYRSLSDDFC